MLRNLRCGLFWFHVVVDFPRLFSKQTAGKQTWPSLHRISCSNMSNLSLKKHGIRIPRQTHSSIRGQPLTINRPQGRRGYKTINSTTLYIEPESLPFFSLRHLLSSPWLSCSLLVVTQIRSHIVGCFLLSHWVRCAPCNFNARIFSTSFPHRLLLYACV